MITENLDDAVDHIAQEIYYEGAYNGADKMDKYVGPRKQELLALIRAEAINLADKIIGKDRVLHSTTDVAKGIDVIDPADKAVYDFQVKQRVMLAEYQNPPKKVIGPSGPEAMINPELSPNEE